MTNATPPPTEAVTDKLTECIVFLDDEGYGYTAAALVEVRDYIRSLQARNAVLEGEKKRMREYLRGRAKVVHGALYDAEADTLLHTLSE